MDKVSLTHRSSPASLLTENNYRELTRPLTARLLEAMELSKKFTRGQGDHLYYTKNNRSQRVLDLTGGYGANLLGHKHPRLLNVMHAWATEGAPTMTQGSERNAAGLLARKLSDLMTKETGEGPWVTTLSNSGTEAIEAGIKHCLLHFKHKLVEISQDIQKEMNQAILRFHRSETALQPRILIRLRSEATNKINDLKMPTERRDYLIHQLANCHDIETLASLLREINERQLSQHPKLIALERGYHGKTLGALAITSNQSFRDAFYLDEAHNQNTLFISGHASMEELSEIIDSTRQDLLLLAISKHGITLAKHSVAFIAGAFAEPIQGEAGVLPVAESTLAILKKFSLQEDFLLVFDEIQTGLYRTGLLASANHAHITADIYTFSKSLGGGMAKIAATVISKRKYIDDFGFLHTSTFAEDELSSLIALEVLEVLSGQDSPVEAGMVAAEFLKIRLEWLRDQFPDVIQDIRGKGLMLAIEFNQDVFSQMGFEFKIIREAKMQGYLISSALLNHENLRMSPSLSNNLTLRIQPSIYFNTVLVEEVIMGIRRVCEALQQNDVKYFLTALYPEEEIANTKTRDLKDTPTLGQRPLSVFLCHMIDEAHIREVSRALKSLPDPKLVEKLNLTKELAQFQIYHHQVLKDEQGQEMDILMLGIPLTSEELKKSFLSRQKYKIVQKVQNAIDYAKELGATTVGLGQFTSIISGNGLYLDPRGMNLTTGNAYTISLTIQSALRSAQEKGKDLSSATVALIGAAGNIMSVAASIMADKTGKIILLHHSPLESSLKFQEAVKRIVSEIAASTEESRIVDVIKRHWTENCDLIEFMQIREVQSVLLATSDLQDIKNADIILSGTSSSSGFLSLDLFKQDAVIVDIAVPPTLKQELIHQIKTLRPDLTYHLGGIAKLPKNQSIDFILLPLGENENFACMAETFALGMSGKKNFLNIGDLNKKIVNEVTAIAQSSGFVLGKIKTESSL